MICRLLRCKRVGRTSLVLRLLALSCGTLMVNAASASAAEVVAWGANGAGQLGDGSYIGPEPCSLAYETPCSLVPVPVSGLGEAKSLAAGAGFGFVLAKDGTVMAWGANGHGQLGDGTTTESDVPVAISGLSEVTQLAAGEDFSLALLKNGTVTAWGEDEYGQLGGYGQVGGKLNTQHNPSPVEVSGLSEVTQIAAGSDDSLALLKNGTVMAWGSNERGELGDGSTQDTAVPTAVSRLSEVAEIAAGQNHSLALLKDGTVMAWGTNGHGQLGNGTTTGSEVPVAVSGISEATAIAAGEFSSVALLRDGTVMAWGTNEPEAEGEPGSYTPVAICAVGEQAPCTQHLSSVTAIAAGPQHTLALLGNGTVVAWGSSDLGQLGDGYLDVTPNHAVVGSEAPVAVDGLSEATTISAAGDSSLAFGTLASLPRVTKLDPASGPAGGGTSVTLTGSNLNDTTAVKFGSTPAGFTIDSDSEITAVSPPGTGMDYVTFPAGVVTPPGSIYVTIQTAAGTSPASLGADLFAYALPESEISTGSGGGQSRTTGAFSGLPSSVLGTTPFATGSPPGNMTIAPKMLTRTQRLAKALRQCTKDKSKPRRAACEKQAHKRYATTARNARKVRARV